MSKILGVIPARYRDSHLPGKILKKIGEKTVLQWVYESAVACSDLDRIVIATDDERVREVAEEIGAEHLMTLESHRTGTDRLAEVAEYHRDYDLIVNVQGNMPGIDPSIISDVIHLKKNKPEWEVVTAARPFKSDEDPLSPHHVKVVVSKKGKALYFSRSLIPFPRRQTGQPVYMHLGVYAFSREFLFHFTTLPVSGLERTEYLEQLRVVENDHTIGVIISNRFALGVDTPEDLKNIQSYYATKGSLR